MAITNELLGGVINGDNVKVEEITQLFSCLDSVVSRKQLAKVIVRQEIDFIHNGDFEDKRQHDEILAISSDPDVSGGRKPKRPSGLPAYLASLYEIPLLTAEQEAGLFRKMNFLKFRANQVRASINPARPSVKKLREFEGFIKESIEIRNRIVQCNLRLVVSIARKFADARHPFDDLVSDGNLALLHAIAKFDYGRGFRFSTYATHAIQRAFYRQMQKKQRRQEKVAAVEQDILQEAPDEYEPLHLDERRYNDVCGLIDQMSEHLDDREKMIIETRFGLVGPEKGETLQGVARQLGICKERVRQLQNRALAKLAELAQQLRIEAPEPSL
ncbi:sigma-70 family RNA polymerase sigma factor [Calycomorphotria hydatis]|uniref:RNA polymerase sigma factor SigA n=1 Tax=Calycomorphotria hydatis TaxID=2528027 RepID=A0A517T6I6_9PLAN|nr:sigma-70 family RNA polymerase sigma factor [Calycomorphotria hydatis]QDT63989.1 RNA polymerase sigma factor SigA [Calycomorphotria hydatis]